MSEETTNEEIVSLSAPKLSALDKLYVRAYLNTLDHVKAHRVVAPSLKSHHENNPFSRKESVQFHISLALQEKMEAISITPEVIIEKLFKEATREGYGSNHAARVTALSFLGKQFGLFQEKKESTVPIINIISYSNDPMKQVSTEAPVLLEDLEDSSLPNNIEIQYETYSE